LNDCITKTYKQKQKNSGIHFSEVSPAYSADKLLKVFKKSTKKPPSNYSIIQLNSCIVLYGCIIKKDWKQELSLKNKNSEVLAV